MNRTAGDAVPRVLVSSAASSAVGDVPRAWQAISLLSLVLALAGLGDWLLAWFPMRLGSPEWEFGTVAASFAGLPLVTLGLMGVLASAIARGIRWQVTITAVVMLLFAAWITAAAVLFLLDVPVALRAVSGNGIARVGIIKAVLKTGMLGALFLTAFVVAGIGALRSSRRTHSR